MKLQGQAAWAIAAALGLMGFAAPASALIKWSAITSTCYGMSVRVTQCTASNATSSTPGLSLEAYSNTASGGQLASAYVGLYGTNGIGVTSEAGPNSSPAYTQESTASPNHAMDNNGNYETLLLKFSSAVTLTELQIGWSYSDSDVSVLAYTGSGTPSLTSRTYSSLTTHGWNLVGNYANVWGQSAGGNANTVAINPGSAPYSSSYWLVGAYNSVFGSGYSTGNDYVKLLAVYGSAPRFQTPEPGSFALLGLGFMALAAARRRGIAS